MTVTAERSSTDFTSDFAALFVPLRMNNRNMSTSLVFFETSTTALNKALKPDFRLYSCYSSELVFENIVCGSGTLF